MAEVSLANTSRGRIKRQAENGQKKAQVLDKLLSESTDIFSTLIVAKSVFFVGFIVSAAVFVVSSHGLSWADVVVAAVVGFVTVALLQSIARAIALKNPDKLLSVWLVFCPLPPLPLPR